MISPRSAKMCEIFCAEYEDILTQSVFNSRSLEHASVRLIQSVAAGVQFPAATAIPSNQVTDKKGVKNG